MKINTLHYRIGFRLQYLKKQIIVFYYNTIIRTVQRISFKRKIIRSPLNYDFISVNSDVVRSLEIKEEDYLLKNVILTCYFIKKLDPQNDVLLENADIKYIEPWYNSIVKLKIKGIIIHDGLDKKFIEQYQNEYIQFREYKCGKYPIYEERWMAYYLFLAKTKIENAFFTDASDVYITNSPFKIITNPYAIYIGRDSANKVGLSEWMMDELNSFNKDSNYKVKKTYYFQQVYNAGVVGGSKQLLLFFISEVIKLILTSKTDFYKDMYILNIVIHNHFFPILKIRPYEKCITQIENDNHIKHKFLVSGFPLNSEFNKFEYNSTALFIHK